VCESVLSQGGLQLEALPALSALESLGVEVLQLVIPESIHPLKLLVAHGAKERQLVRVYVCVYSGSTCS